MPSLVCTHLNAAVNVDDGDFTIHCIVSKHVVYVCFVPVDSETADRTLLQKAAEQVQRNFAGQDDFSPTNLFIATWDGVGHYDEKYERVRLFRFFLTASPAVRQAAITFHL
jgi:hypothetical protein